MKKLSALWIIEGILLFAIIVVFAVQQCFCVFPSYTSNVGEEISADTLLRYKVDNAHFTKNSKPFDIHTPGIYDLEVRAGLFPHRCILTIEDKTPPVILYTEDFDAHIGDSIRYREHVIVSDNSESFELDVDASKVDINNPGRYNVVYTATDPSGNSSLAVVWVTMKEPLPPEEGEMYQKADKVLESIIKENMTKREKALAIHTWIYDNIHYTNYENKSDWIKAASDGFDNMEGDCYVYFAVAKAMLTRAGIVNADMYHYVYPDKMHFWSAVDIGDGHGWYHFDSMTREDNERVFLWTDKQVQKINDGRYDYDRENCPNIP